MKKKTKRKISSKQSHDKQYMYLVYASTIQKMIMGNNKPIKLYLDVQYFEISLAQ